MKFIYGKICVALAILSLPIAGFAYSNYSISPDKSVQIGWECKDSRSCSVFAKSRNGDIFWIWKEGMPEPSVKWLNKSLAEIRVSCGSPCYNSVFYSTTLGLSDPYDFVLAVEPNNMLIAKAELEAISITKIYDKKHRTIKLIERNFSPAASIVQTVKEAKFLNANQLYLRYLVGKDYVSKEETIDFKCIEKNYN